VSGPAPYVSIIVLTHDAPAYCFRTVRSLRLTTGIGYEVVVVDNRSRLPTRVELALLHVVGWIDALCLLPENRLFAAGNNIGSRLASPESTHVVLLNSDVEIRDPEWLAKMLACHRRGATALGFVPTGPVPRADGYCLLVDRDLYLTYELDERYEWWWGVTKLQAELLRDGLSVQAVEDHDDLLVHFGGKSGDDWKSATGMDAREDEIRTWFGERRVTVISAL